MSNNIIDNNDDEIVVKETTIKLSDEKLRGILKRAYERAEQDVSKVKLRKFYSVFLSMAGTLFLTLLTSDFRNVAVFSAECLTIVAWIICLSAATLGIVLLLLYIRDRTSYKTADRDKAVDELFNQYFFDES